MTETDIGELFMAGVVPGLIGIALYCLAVLYVVYRDPAAGPSGVKLSLPERLKALAGIWSTVALFGLVMGGIYAGLFSPTESAGIGAAGALLIAWVRGKASLEMISASLRDAMNTTVSLMMILIGSFIFANLVNAARLPQALVGWVEGLGVAPIVVILLIVGIYVILGCVLESISMMLLTVPVFYPLVASLGYDLIWFGIVVVVVVEISLITPPVGLNVFVLKSVLPEVRLTTIFRGVMPFVMADFIRAGLIIGLPSLSLMLPALMR